MCLMIAAVVLCQGCVWSVGGAKKDTHIQSTQGQELIDLKLALDQKAITEEEYETLKQRIMNE